MHRLLEIVETRINPLMLKEVQQSVRGPMLRTFGLIALMIPLFVFGMKTLADHDNTSGGRAGFGFFMVLALLVGAIGGLLVPLRAALQLYTEIRTRTLDLIVLTTLSPWQLAHGRFQAAALQICLLFAFALPFSTACITLGGIDVAQVFGTLSFLFVSSLLQASALLAAASSVLASVRVAGLAALAVLCQAVGSMAVCIAVVMDGAFGRLDLLTVVWIFALLALATLLCLRLSADLLTPYATQSYARSKACLAALLAVFFLPLWLGNITDDDLRLLVLVAGLALLYTFAVLWSSTPSRSSSGAPLWRRLFDDGYDATSIYTAVLTGAVAGAAAVRGWQVEVPLLALVYFVFLTGTAVLVHSFLPRGMRTAHNYANALAWSMAANAAAGGVCKALRREAAPKQLVDVLVTLFPLGLEELSQVRELAPLFALPLVLGFTALIGARRRNARLTRG